MIRRLVFYFSNLIKYIRTGSVVYMNLSTSSKGMILRGKRIIVTGGSSGIGLEIAKKFISEGASVLITGRNKNKLEELRKEVNSDKFYVLNWDLSKLDECKNKFLEAVKLLGGIDILVNNAGVYTTNSFLEIKDEEWERVMNTNIKGVFFLCQAAVDHFINHNKAKTSKILNISSIRGIQGDCGPYGISKWGLNCLTRGMARDYVKQGILVNAIAPGPTATGINGIDISYNAYSSEPKNERIGLPEDIAELALYFASDSSNNVTGQIICCDGGTTLF